MKFEKLLYSLLIIFLIGACRVNRDAEVKAVAIVGNDGQVFLFQKYGSKILIQKCKKGTVLEEGTTNASCKSSTKTTVSKTDFRHHLEASLHVSNVSFGSEEEGSVEFYKQEKNDNTAFLENEHERLTKKIKERDDFIKKWDEEAGQEGTEDLLVMRPELEKIATQLTSKSQQQDAVQKINETMDTLIDIIMKDELEIYPISEGSFFYHILYTYVNTPSFGWEFKRISEVNGGVFPTTFWMGSKSNESDHSDDEGPYHQVTIHNDFEIGVKEVTQSQWFNIMGLHPSKFSTPTHCPKSYDLKRSLCPNHPVENVSWDDVQVFLTNLNRHNDGYHYRLPSEAEWEYAARAGTTTPFNFGPDLLVENVNYDGRNPYREDFSENGLNRMQTVPVGSLANANNFDLYDMHGNVWELTQDRWHGDYENAPSDGSAWSTGKSSLRVIRGGSWYNNAHHCRSANRSPNGAGYRLPVVGLRLVRTYN